MFLIEVSTDRGNCVYSCAHYEIVAETALLLISAKDDPNRIIATYRDWQSVIEIEHQRRTEEGIL